MNRAPTNPVGKPCRGAIYGARLARARLGRNPFHFAQDHFAIYNL